MLDTSDEHQSPPSPQAADRTVSTGGGDYAEGNIDKRKGIFGGTFYGPVIGVLEVTLAAGGVL